MGQVDRPREGQRSIKLPIQRRPDGVWAVDLVELRNTTGKSLGAGVALEQGVYQRGEPVSTHVLFAGEVEHFLVSDHPEETSIHSNPAVNKPQVDRSTPEYAREVEAAMPRLKRVAFMIAEYPNDFDTLVSRKEREATVEGRIDYSKLDPDLADLALLMDKVARKTPNRFWGQEPRMGGNQPSGCRLL